MKMKKLHEHLVENNNWYAKWHKSSYFEIVHYVALLIIVVVVVVNINSISKIPSSSLTARAYPFEDLRFADRMGGKSSVSGEEAVRALGNDISRVAIYYGNTGQELAYEFRTEKSLRIDKNGLLFYAETELPEKASPGDGSIPNNPTVNSIPDASTFYLHSNPNATAKIYLNFKGATTTGTVWNVSGPIVSAPYSRDADPAFNAQELSDIKAIWLNTSEDYAAYNVDVTTEKPLNPDLNHYAHLILSPTYEWYGSAGGVAYVGSFRWNDATPSFVFTGLLSNDNKFISEAASHEIGHMTGLRHVASYDASCVKLSNYSYGNTNWAPIMGVGYYKRVTQWANTNDTPLLASSVGCSSQQVDSSIITGTAATNNGDLRFLNDEAGNTSATSSVLSRTVSSGVASVDHSGVLTLNDADMYRIETTGGNLNFSVLPMNPIGLLYGNADFRVRLLNSNLSVLSESDPGLVATATVSASNISSGIYYLEISAVGYLNFDTGGYSTAGSMGRYQVVGIYNSGGDITPPVTSITSPLSGAIVSGTVNISATASDNNSVSKVEFYYDGIYIGGDLSSPYSISWNTTTVANSTYNLTAKAYDASGNTATSSIISVSVANIATPPPPADTTLPVVSISSPLNNATVSGTTTIRASAIDNVKVTKMEILVNNIVVKSTTKSSISYKWNTGNASIGSHTIVVKAYDAAGNVGESSVTVTK